MKTVTSISGGKTSAYLAANYKADDLVFALVRTSDLNCKFKDEALRKRVEDCIQKPFVGTLEDDKIIKTIFDLEQFLGQKIDWVSGLTFDEVVETKGTWLPSALRRYCTTWLKIDPIFYWWAEKYNFEPVQMNIGYRYSERNRAEKMRAKLNADGLSEYKATFEKKAGKNRWIDVPWRKPAFPLIDDQVFKDEIENFWELKPVSFAGRNNCVGCFNRSAAVLNQIANSQDETIAAKYDWFVRKEGGRKKYWKENISYQKIKDARFPLDLFASRECESGFCEP